MLEHNRRATGQEIGEDLKRPADLKSIHSTTGGLIIRQEPNPDEILDLNGEYPEHKLISGTYNNGFQYYDLKNIHFINNNDMVHLIDLLRTLLKKGVEVRFINVNSAITKKIKDMGLDHILTCI